MTLKLPHYPYSCPVCRETASIDLVDDEHDEDEFVESWQCDGCGAQWACRFELVETLLDEIEPT